VDTIHDFEDMLELLDRHRVRYLIIGGLAFIYHAKPRYTKDMDLWLDSEPENVERANLVLSEFGSPQLLDPDDPDEILQLGAGPNRIAAGRRSEPDRSPPRNHRPRVRQSVGSADTRNLWPSAGQLDRSRQPDHDQEPH